jgi:hypothetical protein
MLLTTAFLGLAALWVLARIRFPDRPATPNPVPPLLTQIAAGAKFDDLASEVSQIQSRLDSYLLALGVPPSGQDATSGTPYLPVALRIRDDAAVTLLDTTNTSEHPGPGPPLMGSDAASGLAVVRVPSAPALAREVWSPQRMQRPRYLIASDVSREGVSLRPVFVGSLHPIATPEWPGTIWAMPAQTDLRRGSFVFTPDAALAGLVIEHEDGPAIVPGELLIAEANRLLSRPDASRGELGVEVQPLTPGVARATGAHGGVVVTWVDSHGAAAGALAVGDVVEAVDGETLSTARHWDVRMARLSAGQTIVLGVRRRGELRDLPLVAVAPPAPAATPTLGLTMRRAIRGVGVEVVRVDRESVASKAGLQAGDLITRIADIEAPTPAQVRRAFASTPDGRPVLVAVTRGEIHRVTTLEK